MLSQGEIDTLKKMPQFQAGDPKFILRNSGMVFTNEEGKKYGNILTKSAAEVKCNARTGLGFENDARYIVTGEMAMEKPVFAEWRLNPLAEGGLFEVFVVTPGACANNNGLEYTISLPNGVLAPLAGNPILSQAAMGKDNLFTSIGIFSLPALQPVTARGKIPLKTEGVSRNVGLDAIIFVQLPGNGAGGALAQYPFEDRGRPLYWIDDNWYEDPSALNFIGDWQTVENTAENMNWGSFRMIELIKIAGRHKFTWSFRLPNKGVYRVGAWLPDVKSTLKKTWGEGKFELRIEGKLPNGIKQNQLAFGMDGDPNLTKLGRIQASQNTFLFFDELKLPEDLPVGLDKEENEYTMTVSLNDNGSPQPGAVLAADCVVVLLSPTQQTVEPTKPPVSPTTPTPTVTSSPVPVTPTATQAKQEAVATPTPIPNQPVQNPLPTKQPDEQPTQK